MEIFDTLTCPASKAPFFTVDLDEQSVALSLPAEPRPYLENASGANQFQAGDNFSILSAGIIIPYSFTPYVSNTENAAANRLKIQIDDTAGRAYSLPELGAESQVHIPLENYEVGLGIFIPVVTKTRDNGGQLLTGNFLLRYAITGMVISMLSVPLDFAGMSIPVFPYLKIIHNFPMISGEYPAELSADFTYSIVEG